MRRTLRLLLAAAVTTAATAATAAVAASAAVPAHPAWESSARFGAWNNGGFIVYNNEWNSSAGPQRIWANSYRSWGVQSDQPAGNVAVETYPCVQKNYNNVPVSSYRLIENGFTESMPAGARGLDAEAADDIWLDGYRLEVMIWVDNHGQRPAGNVVGHATIFGQRFAVWRGGSTFSFVLNHNEISGVTHILAAIQWLIGHGYLPPSVSLTQVNFGWEIAATDGKPMDFTVSKYWLATRRS
jgi:hypothetical protein